MASASAERTFRLTLDLIDTGIDLMRQNLRRTDPDAGHEEIERRLRAWIRERPGAEHGDCLGRPIDVGTRIG